MRKDSWLEAAANKVARAVQNPNWGDQTLVDDAKIAIGVIIESLAAEAEAEIPALRSEMRLTEAGALRNMADWLRAHLDAGRDGEATDAQ